MQMIDRHALLQRVYEHPYERNGMTDAEWCRKCIYEAPTIEAEPVKRGHWILTSDEQYEYCRCSECGYDTGENWMIGSEIKYCENCGARMDLRTPTEVALDFADSVMGGAENG